MVDTAETKIEAQKLVSESKGRDWMFAFTNADGLKARIAPATIGDVKIWTVLVSHPKRDGGKELVDGELIPIFFDFQAAVRLAREAVETRVKGNDGKLKRVTEVIE